ncbi:hypothetical protein MRX96_038949 [Rhipicephalus microplus]
MGEEARCARALERPQLIRSRAPAACSSNAGVAALRRARFVRGRRAPRPRSVDWQLDSARRPRALQLKATAAARSSLADDAGEVKGCKKEEKKELFLYTDP